MLIHDRMSLNNICLYYDHSQKEALVLKIDKVFWAIIGEAPLFGYQSMNSLQNDIRITLVDTGKT